MLIGINLSEKMAFGPYAYEHIINIPRSLDSTPLKDLELRVYGQPSSGSTIPQSGLCPSDVRVYFKEIEITASVIELLKDALREFGLGEATQAYSAAMDNWLTTAAKLGASYPGDIAAERTLAANLVSNEIYLERLNTLGSIDASVFGFGGMLHPFNYLYRYIPMPSLKLSAIVARHNSAGGTQIGGDDFNRPTLTVSSGPWRAVSPAWDPAEVTSTGRITLDVLALYENPLLARVQRLEAVTNQISVELKQIGQRVGSLEVRTSDLEDKFEVIVEQLDLIIEKVGPGEQGLRQTHLEPILRSLSDIQPVLLKLVENKDLLDQVKAMSTGVQGLKAAVDSLR